MPKKMEVIKEFIEDFAMVQNECLGIGDFFIASQHRKVGNGVVVAWALDSYYNEIIFTKIWAGEIELVEKQDRYVIYQFDKRGDVWLLFQHGFGVVSVSAPLSKTTKANEHDMYRSSNAHFDQDFAFAMRDTGKFKIEKVVE